MRTTLDIDIRLLKEAMMRLKAKTKKETVERGLVELIRVTQRQSLQSMNGNDLEWTLELF